MLVLLHRRIAFFVFTFCCAVYASAADAPKAIVIVLDGLRPDYVTQEAMPNVYALGQRGVVCANHHSVFPTVTRVNSSTFSTGCYPARHGIMGNTIYVPAVDKEKGFSTGDAKNLMKLNEVTGGKVLTVPTLGEILESAGMKLFVASSGSSGSSFLLNPHVKGGGIVNTEMVLPEFAKAHVDELLGPVPDEAIHHRCVAASCLRGASSKHDLLVDHGPRSYRAPEGYWFRRDYCSVETRGRRSRPLAGIVESKGPGR